MTENQQFQNTTYSHYPNNNNKPEKLLNICSIVLFIAGVIAFVFYGIKAVFETPLNWMYLGIGAGVFFISLTGFAFFQVVINISRKLNQ